MTNKVLESEIKGHGFYGTINNRFSTEKTDQKWTEAFKTLTQLSNKKPEEIRDYLDSKSGRKLADCVIDSQDDLKTTIVKEYIKWVEFDLFECDKKEFTATNKILFGTKVHDDVNNKYVLVLSEGKIKGLNGNYLRVLDCNEKIYIIKQDFLSPTE
ncbi:hypothetical protein J6O48_09515 [bacterium]|nr:hypothetical protein [bacterium]